jgi:hypothetical protein
MSTPCPLYPPKTDIGQHARSLIIGCSGPPSTSNKIIQIGLAFSLRQSGTVSSFGALAALRDPCPAGFFAEVGLR